jgi:hypothetical protein
MKVLLMTLVLMLLLAGCAAGQGGAGRSIAEEETTGLKAERDLRRPPSDSTLSYGGRELKGQLGSYCWSYGSSSMCADGAAIAPPRKQALTVPSGSEMVFRYGGQRPPYTVKAHAYTLKKGEMVFPTRSLKVHKSGGEWTIAAELPPGEYDVDVYVEEQQGGADYDFYVKVE